MTKYVFKRLLHGLVSVVIVVAIVMVMIYSLLDRQLVFSTDNVYRNLGNNQQVVYKYSKWEEYGYIDYVPYADYLLELAHNGEIDEETRSSAVKIGKKATGNNDTAKEYVAKFTEYYESKGYTVQPLKAVMVTSKKYASGGQEQLFAYKDKSLFPSFDDGKFQPGRLLSYFSGILKVDNIHKVQDDIGERGISFTTHDPVYDGTKFSPAIMGNGTLHKYLLYTDNQFPYVHQNLVKLQLGVSYTVNSGVDVWDTMTQTQGSQYKSLVTYPTGLTEESADDLHSAIYVSGSREANPIAAERFDDDYTGTNTSKQGMSRMGYSFSIGILSSLMAYLLGVPMGIWMALKKDKLVDKIGTFYIIFIIAVPSLAYIFMFKAIGSRVLGLPGTFNMDAVGKEAKLMYILPVISLALPSVANLMKWLRRYMIDQMNSDYVKFARSGGLSESEIFTRHILKNAIIPIVHGIPGTVLFAMTGAIITERVYVVPGVGNVLTTAINNYDNGVIVGVTLFYAILSVVSIILGDVFMSLVDPRISFTSKAR